MEILWEFSKKIGIFWHICGKNIEKIGLGKLKINRKSLPLSYSLMIGLYWKKKLQLTGHHFRLAGI